MRNIMEVMQTRLAYMLQTLPTLNISNKIPDVKISAKILTKV